MDITIKPLTSLNEIKKVQKLEQDVWNMQPIPIHQTFTAAKNGGILIGAYHGEKLVGFSYGFPGFKGREVYLCSHMMGILPEYQSRNLGERLKKEQKRIALEKGYKLITWTFDPLESVNAYLNLHKLRAITGCYHVNLYGEMDDSLNQGLPTDRFQLEWWIEENHVNEKVRETVGVNQNHCWFQTGLNEDGLLFILNQNHVSLKETSSPLFVPIPDHFQIIKKRDPELAIDWRLQTREVFQRLIFEGYVATDIIRKPDEKVCYYVFEPRHLLDLPDAFFKEETHE